VAPVEFLVDAGEGPRGLGSHERTQHTHARRD
jgi:hypothetical protein